jgi:hypothetical protein
MRHSSAQHVTASLTDPWISRIFFSPAVHATSLIQQDDISNIKTGGAMGG